MSTYSATVVADSATFYYRLGDASGHLVDAIGGANTTSETGVTYGAAGGIANDPGTAISCNGTTTIAQTATGANAGRDFADGPFTIELWVQVADIGVSRIPVDRGHTVGNGWMIVRRTNNTWGLADSSAGTAIVFTSVTNTDTVGFHHVVATKNGATSKMYFDGADVTSAGTNVTLTNSTDGLAIGRSPGFSFHSGKIQEFAGYSVVLTAAQVLNHYNVGHFGQLAHQFPYPQLLPQ